MRIAIRFLYVACFLLLAATPELVAGDRTHASRQYVLELEQISATLLLLPLLLLSAELQLLRLPASLRHLPPGAAGLLVFLQSVQEGLLGSLPIARRRQGAYSLLAPNDRKGSLEQIPESAFPEPSAMPPIPESNDEAVMEMPPDDLPDRQALPK